MDEYPDWKALNEIVEMYGIDKSLATNRMWGGKIPSDLVFSTWEQFVVRNVATTKLDKTYADVKDWGPRECGDYYRSVLLGDDGNVRADYKLHVANNRPVNDLVSGSGSDDAIKVLEYRWNNGFCFLDYRKRIDLALDKHIYSIGMDATVLVQKMEAAMDALKQVRGELSDIIRLHPISDRARYVLENIKEELTVRQFWPADSDE